jgi:hypothetical protein
MQSVESAPNGKWDFGNCPRFDWLPCLQRQNIHKSLWQTLASPKKSEEARCSVETQSNAASTVCILDS